MNTSCLPAFRRNCASLVPAYVAACWLLLCWTQTVAADYSQWKHSGGLFLLTTPDGADLPAGAVVENFPVLVRLHRDSFDFRQARPGGDDLRFSTVDGRPLAYQIEQWDAAAGQASVWVRVPKIEGASRQQIRLHWGHPTAAAESNGRAVFDASNGYLSVWHMNEPVRDEVGTLSSTDVGTQPAAGMIGPARRLGARQGVFGGDKIEGYPTGAEPHTSECWFRAERPNGRVLAWGNEHAQGKVVMFFQSPPHVRMDCYFSGANVAGQSRLPLGKWVHVAHVYQKGDSRLYVDGKLDGVSTSAGSPLAIKSPSRLWIGGWYNNYDFVGDVDEVRVSRTARSADWIRLEYENQKPHQTLVGPVVRSAAPAAAFSVGATTLMVDEGRTATVVARADGAHKVYWIEHRADGDAIVAADRFSYTLDAGRVVGDQTRKLSFRAIYAGETKSQTVDVTVRERIPEPQFTLVAPSDWDGRRTIEAVPQITNLAALQAAGAGELNYVWTVDGLATTRQTAPGRLLLKRAQNSGALRVTLALDNGGAATVASTVIQVREPARDAWVVRTPGRDEKPVDNQFFARDDKNEGTLVANGTLAEPAESVLLRVLADDQPYKTATATPGADRSYALTVKLRPGLIKYRAELVAKTGDRETILHTASNLICGDVYLIDGQSNADATDVGKEDPTFTSTWIRSFGSMSGGAQQARLERWGDAVVRDRMGGKAQIGAWGMELARLLVERHKTPICIINGAVGGSRIDQHQRNAADPTDVTTIYGRLLWRVERAGLTHGVRGVLWHQGENDQGADGPTGGFGWETYRQYFIDMTAAWKDDYPNLQRYYTFQIWPRACSMGSGGSDNRLREVQRTMSSQFSNLSVMSTLGIQPPGGCHFPLEGYLQFARLIGPLVERDLYGVKAAGSITAPDVKRIWFTGPQRDELALEFDQPVVWTESLASQFYLDGRAGQVASGAVSGSTLRLKLVAPSTATKATYLDSTAWRPENLLRGENGIAALSFCEVAIEAP